jgi:hypothetical protein
MAWSRGDGRCASHIPALENLVCRDVTSEWGFRLEAVGVCSGLHACTHWRYLDAARSCRSAAGLWADGCPVREPDRAGEPGLDPGSQGLVTGPHHAAVPFVVANGRVAWRHEARSNEREELWSMPVDQSEPPVRLGVARKGVPGADFVLADTGGELVGCSIWPVQAISLYSSATPPPGRSSILRRNGTCGVMLQSGRPTTFPSPRNAEDIFTSPVWLVGPRRARDSSIARGGHVGPGLVEKALAEVDSTENEVGGVVVVAPRAGT